MVPISSDVLVWVFVFVFFFTKAKVLLLFSAPVLCSAL